MKKCEHAMTALPPKEYEIRYQMSEMRFMKPYFSATTFCLRATVSGDNREKSAQLSLTKPVDVDDCGNNSKELHDTNASRDQQGHLVTLQTNATDQCRTVIQ